MKIYVTFGQEHRHELSVLTWVGDGWTFVDRVFDKDCVAVIECKDHNEGRDIAFKKFGPQFFFTYTVDTITPNFMKHFPRGLLEV